MSDPMPADLKLKEVARDIICEYVTATNGAHCTAQFSEAEQIVESRLQTLVAEVRAQAMEEAAKIAKKYRDGVCHDGESCAGCIVSQQIETHLEQLAEEAREKKSE
jgi:hypothetical protein